MSTKRKRAKVPKTTRYEYIVKPFINFYAIDDRLEEYTQGKTEFTLEIKGLIRQVLTLTRQLKTARNKNLRERYETLIREKITELEALDCQVIKNNDQSYEFIPAKKENIENDSPNNLLTLSRN